MSEHSWAAENMAAYGAEGLNADERERLEQHADQCGGCAQALAQMRGLDAKLTHLFATARPEPGLESRMIEGLRAAPTPRQLRFGFWMKCAMAAAAMLLLGLLGAAMPNFLLDDGLHAYGYTGGIIGAQGDEPMGWIELIDNSESMKERSYFGLLRGSTINGMNFKGPQESTNGKEQADPTFFPDRIEVLREMLNIEAEPFEKASPSQVTYRQSPSQYKVRERTGYFDPTHSLKGKRESGGDKDKEKKEGGAQKQPDGEKKKDKDDGKPQGEEPPAERKIIRRGEMDFEVEVFEDAVAEIRRLIGDIKGAYIATRDSDRLADGKVRGSVTVRVPPLHLDKFVLDLRQALGKAGELKSLQIGSDDVTKHYVDVESALKAARAMEERFLNIIKTGQGQIKDLIAAERELGLWRTKIEEMEGEIRYVKNMVALSTLKISLVEKTLVVSERVVMQIKVEDVEKRLHEALKAVADAKGRVLKSEMKQHTGGQMEAILEFEVSPAAAAPIGKMLQGLGAVTKHDAERQQRADGGGGASRDNTRRKDVKFQVGLHNLANIKPQETFNLHVATQDVPGGYHKLRQAVKQADGRIRSGKLDEDDKLKVSAELEFDVPRRHKEAMDKTLAQLGEVYSRSTVRAKIGESASEQKVGYWVGLRNANLMPPREKIGLIIEVRNVVRAADELIKPLRDRKDMIVVGPALSRKPAGDIASLLITVPMSAKDELLRKIEAVGTVHKQEAVPDPRVPDSALATAQIEVILTSVGPIVPGGEGLWPQIRTSLFYSFKLLSWSLMFIILGVSVAVPWALLIFIGYKLLRRLRRKPETPTAA